MAKKSRVLSLLDDVAEKVIKPEPQGIRAYHGSPHDFDRFDLSKIGTGEGAQAYGHGLYFAESEPIAKGYRDTLSKSGNDGALRRLQQAGGDIDAAISQAQQKAANYRAGGADRYATAVEDDLRALMKFKETGDWSPGHMYEVNIRANPEDFLDWDKPLAVQSENVLNAVKKIDTAGGSIADLEKAAQGWRDTIARAEASGRTDGFVKAAQKYLEQAETKLFDAKTLMSGQDFLTRNQGGLGGGKGSIEWALRDEGIPGIKYLDAGSRAAGDGSRNYVVFDDKLIDILRKYGIVPAGLLGAGAAMAPYNADAAPSRPNWIGDNGAITGNPPWLRPDPNERSTLGKLYDAVTTNPVGTFKAAGSALGNAVKGYIGDVRQDPGKGVADALELGATAMGGAAPQAFWMATSPSEANAGEDAILAQRRKMMQGLLAD